MTSSLSTMGFPSQLNEVSGDFYGISEPSRVFIWFLGWLFPGSLVSKSYLDTVEPNQYEVDGQINVYNKRFFFTDLYKWRQRIYLYLAWDKPYQCCHWYTYCSTYDFSEYFLESLLPSTSTFCSIWTQATHQYYIYLDILMETTRYKLLRSHGPYWGMWNPHR